MDSENLFSVDDVKSIVGEALSSVVGNPVDEYELRVAIVIKAHVEAKRTLQEMRNTRWDSQGRPRIP